MIAGNIYVCIWTIYMFSVCFADESSLTRTPSDLQAFKGDKARFKCFTENKNYPPNWSHTTVTSSEPKDVYIVYRKDGNDVLAKMVAGYHERFKVHENRETGEYSLEISNVQPEDAGTYTCTGKGGLGQKSSAQLVVLDSSPECSTNVTEAIGDNICNKDPDYIALTCKFHVHGNSLPQVYWVNNNHPDLVLWTERASWANEPSLAYSEFVLRADNESCVGSVAFRCVVTESNSMTVNGTSPDARFSCITQVIKVLKIKNQTVSQTLLGPDEVECKWSSELKSNGRKWVKKFVNKEEEEREEQEEVTTKSILNLYRPGLGRGTYVCIVECEIHGEICQIEAHTINYQPAEATHSSSNNVGLIIPVIISAVVICTILLGGIALWKYRKSTQQGQLGTKTSRSNPENSPSDGSTPSTHLSLLGKEEGHDDHCESSHESEVSSGSTPSTHLSLLGKEEGHDDHCGSNRGSEVSSDNTVIDIPDAKLGRPGSREERLRQIEERARRRMKENAESQGQVNNGFSPTKENVDFAEGIGQSNQGFKEKDE